MTATQTSSFPMTKAMINVLVLELGLNTPSKVLQIGQLCEYWEEQQDTLFLITTVSTWVLHVVQTTLAGFFP